MTFFHAGLMTGLLATSIAMAQSPGYQLQASLTPDRGGATQLDGSSVSHDLFVFTTPDTPDIARVRFYLDDPGLTGPPRKIENFPPYDLAGTTSGGQGAPFDTTTLTDGPHTVTAVIERSGATSVTIHATMTVSNAIPELVFAPDILSLTAEPDTLVTQTVDLSTTNEVATPYDLVPNVSWLRVEPHTQTTSARVPLSIDTTGLSTGTHIATLVASAPDFASDILMIAVSIGGDYALLASNLPSRANPMPLDGSTVAGDVAVFISPESDVLRVNFYIDNTALIGSPDKIENLAPFDLGGTNSDDTALLWDSARLSDGRHTITARIELHSGAEQIRTATFTIDNEIPSLGFAPPSASFSLDSGESASTTIALSTSNAGVANYSLAEDAPWLTVTPMGGALSATTQIMLDVDATGLAPATYSTSITATAAGYISAVLPVSMTVTTDDYQLWVSPAPNRSLPDLLGGARLRDDAFVFILPETGVQRVRFFLDDPQLLGSPQQTENRSPYDFAGTASNGDGQPFDMSALASGPHTITAAVDLTSGGTVTISEVFDVATGVAALNFAPGSLTLEVDLGGAAVALTSDLTASDDANVPFNTATSETWVSVASTGTTPRTLSITVDPSDLNVGTHAAQITATTDDYLDATLDITVTVSAGPCWPLPCGELKITPPYVLSFDEDHGKLPDGSGHGTGFTRVDPPASGNGWIPQLLDLDPTAGVLRITTTAGLNYLTSNTLDNALTVGIDAPSQISVLETTLVNPPRGSGNYEQAGLLWTVDQDNYVKLIVLSTPSDTFVELTAEVAGQIRSTTRTPFADLSNANVHLTLRADPGTLEITGIYRFDEDAPVELGAVDVTPEMFSFDAAGIDPAIGTRTFGGIFASQRNGSTPLVYEFDHFTVTAETPTIEPGELAFDRVVIPMNTPTAMAWGPDDRLYVTELHGTVHAFTLDRHGTVIDEEIIATFNAGGAAPRLTLGITIDPFSTPTDVALWVNHSSPSLTAGEANSGTVTRLSGPGFGIVEDIITGLPRAIANHAPNSLHFGPDDRLYIAIGGNTGAGSPNTAASEFGPMEEQPLSAAILVADVFAADFDGSCDNTVDIFGPPPCDVVTYATGLRNTYDFAFHPNGSMYATDNGLGVTGTYPPTPSAPCLGLSNPAAWDAGGHNPGTQPDLLHRIIEGAYYGHPNPYRDECVYKDGSFQGVMPLANFEPPMAILGDHTSSNGIIAYDANVFCGQLQGDLLVANYSVGDNVIRLQLSDDGTSVIDTSVLADSFNNPLPLAQSPEGVVFVGEFGGGTITALIPVPPGCWARRADKPASTLDAGGAALDGMLYSVAGKVSTGPINTVYRYDPETDTWATAADLPGPGVENPALVPLDGLLYAFGGSTAPFSGAVDNAAVFDPTTDTWTSLTAMPTPRGGASAQTVNGLIYVAGGLDGSGASTATVEVYDPLTDMWSGVSPMSTPRDNPGSAVVDGLVYVFGGRTRLADGTEVDGTLDTMEAYNPNTDVWIPRANMPTGRRTFASGILRGEIIAAGGEKTPGGDVFPAAEAYDATTDTWRSLVDMPTPRHGVAAGVIDGALYIAGGGTTGGGAFSPIVERLSFGEVQRESP